MKLALVTETFPPEINGVAMTLGHLVAGLCRLGHTVAVVAPARRDRPVPGAGPHTLIPVPGLPIPRYPELRFGLPAGRRLRRLWRTARPDLVHVATEGPLGWSALAAARRLGIPAVSSFHTNFHSYGRHYGYGLLRGPVLAWLRRFHNRTLRTFAPSSDVLDRLAADGFANLRLLARGVDTDLFGPHRRDPDLRRQWGAADGTPVALYTGRLAGEKNLDLVLAAHARMRELLPDLRLVMVGDGPERERARRRCPEAHFAGMRRGSDLAAHYASADCFLFASLTETFGNVVTEAMASALPVLAFNYAAPARFIRDGVNGLLAPPGDAPAFLRQAAVLAARRAGWADMGRAARAAVLPFSWEAVIDAYLAELHSLPGLSPAASS